MSNNSAKLMPCPFCGGEAERLDFAAVEGDPNAGGSCICCKQCGASSPVHFDRKENLESSWNTRTARTAPLAVDHPTSDPESGRGQPSPDYVAGQALADYLATWKRVMFDVIGDQKIVDRLFVLADLNGLFDPAKVAIDALPLAAASDGPKPRPADCVNPMGCGWHKANTRPDVNMWLCSEPNCGHGAKAWAESDTTHHSDAHPETWRPLTAAALRTREAEQKE